MVCLSTPNKMSTHTASFKTDFPLVVIKHCMNSHIISGISTPCHCVLYKEISHICTSALPFVLGENFLSWQIHLFYNLSAVYVSTNAVRQLLGSLINIIWIRDILIQSSDSVSLQSFSQVPWELYPATWLIPLEPRRAWWRKHWSKANLLVKWHQLPPNFKL